MDEKGKQLEKGLEGEVCIKGLNVTLGYENNPIKVPLNLLSRMEEAYAKL
jgi:hypothetical protein